MNPVILLSSFVSLALSPPVILSMMYLTCDVCIFQILVKCQKYHHTDTRLEVGGISFSTAIQYQDSFDLWLVFICSHCILFASSCC
jgi:hypothetical protein